MECTQADIVNVPDIFGVQRNLFRQHGLLTMQNVVGSCECCVYWTAELSSSEFKAALSMSRKLYIPRHKGDDCQGIREYYIHATPVGPLFSKHLTSKAVVDTAVNSNIEQFNQWVRVNRQPLLARDEQVDDLMIHLFSGYQQAQECKVREYISDKKVAFKEGQQIAPDAFMTYTSNYYSIHRNRKMRGQKVAEEQILALTSIVEELRDANLKLTKSLAGVKKGGQKENGKKKKVDQKKKGKGNEVKRYPKLADIKPGDPNFGWMVELPG
eukprot:10908984-Ditylum_brightwellii.AAC.1